MKIRTLVAAFGGILLSGLVHAQPVAGPAGLLTDARGHVLYTFDKDSEGKSACYDQCAALWPPYVAAADARASGDYSLVARTDGSRQWAVRGKPLYFYAGDSAPGHTNGDGVKQVWHVVRDKAAPAGTASSGSYRPDGY